MESKPQVFLRGEVVTMDDLIAIRNGYIYLHEETNSAEDRYQFLVAAGAVESIMAYLKRGKTPIREIEQ